MIESIKHSAASDHLCRRQTLRPLFNSDCIIRDFRTSADHRIARLYCEIEDRILQLRRVGFNQAYKEEYEHPIIVICASDIGRLLKSAGIGDTSDVSVWLEAF